MIKVGLGGTKNLDSHRRSKGCQDGATKLAQAESDNRIQSNFRSFFTTKPQVPPTPITPIPQPPLIKPTPAPTSFVSAAHPPGHPSPCPALPFTPSVNPNPSLHASSEPSPKATVIRHLLYLETLARSLPDSVPNAIASDKIAAWGDDGAAAVATHCSDNRLEDSENVMNHMLHLVWSTATDEDIRKLVRCGSIGLAGYAKVLRYFVEERDFPTDAMGSRIERLVNIVEAL